MSRFVSAGTNADEIERDDEWIKAQKEIEDKRQHALKEGEQEGGKTLYEVLQANKAKKQEAFEESIRLKNQFRSLDEDEVDFLDSVLESTRAQEANVRKETTEQLDHFRKQQQAAEKEIRDEEGSPEAEDGQWAAPGKKRKKSHGKESLLGLKLRKTTSVGEESKTETEKLRPRENEVMHSSNKSSSTTMSKVVKPHDAGKDAGAASTQPAATASNQVQKSPSPSATGLRLGAYSSDEDD